MLDMYNMSYRNTSNEQIESSTCLYDKSTFDIDGNPSVQILNCILTIPTSLAATLANLLVLISIVNSPSLHKPCNTLLLNLAMSDLGVGLVVQPTFVIFNIAKIKGLEGLFCSSTRVLSVAGFCLSGVSFFTLTGISLDRYIAIRLHLRYEQIVTVKRVTAILVSIWLMLLVGATSILWASYKFVDYLSLMVIFVCLVVTCFAYSSIYLVVRRHQAQISALIPAQLKQNSFNIPRFRKSCWTMILIHAVFISCFLPYLIVMFVMSATGRSVLKQSIYEITFAIVFINSTFNPIVYCWRIGEIRAAVLKTLKSMVKQGPVHSVKPQCESYLAGSNAKENH